MYLFQNAVLAPNHKLHFSAGFVRFITRQSFITQLPLYQDVRANALSSSLQMYKTESSSFIIVTATNIAITRMALIRMIICGQTSLPSYAVDVLIFRQLILNFDHQGKAFGQ